MCKHQDDWWYNADQHTKNALIAGIKRGDIWLKSCYQNGKRIEVTSAWKYICLTRHMLVATCQPVPVNTTTSQLCSGYAELCELHGSTGAVIRGIESRRRQTSRTRNAGIGKPPSTDWSFLRAIDEPLLK